MSDPSTGHPDGPGGAPANRPETAPDAAPLLAADDGSSPEDRTADPASAPAPRKRRRGSRGGRNRNRPGAAASSGGEGDGSDDVVAGDSSGSSAGAPEDTPAPPAATAPAAPAPVTARAVPPGPGPAPSSAPTPAPPLPSPTIAAPAPAGTQPSGPARPAPPGEAAGPSPAPPPPDSAGPGVESPPKPKIGDTRPAPMPRPAPLAATSPGRPAPSAAPGSVPTAAVVPGLVANRPASPRPGAARASAAEEAEATGSPDLEGGGRRRRRRGGRGRVPATRPVETLSEAAGDETDEDALDLRRGRERKGRPVGRYLMVVHVQPQVTQIAVLEGRALIEHYVSRPADDVSQIDGNIYLGRVQNVLPGMEAAFVDIGTPKNAVLYRGDVRYDREEMEGDEGGADAARPARARGDNQRRDARIEQLLKAGQTIVCQVTKNPIGTKGARLTQEVSLPGRFVVLIPNSEIYGISKRLGDEERKRLRRVLDEIRPAGHGLIVRTAAEGASADELRRDVQRLLDQWRRIEALAGRSRAPTLLYREPDMAVRVIREEFNKEYRGVIIDDPQPVRGGPRVRCQHQPGAGGPGRICRRRPRAPCRCSSATTCTSSSTRLSTGRCGCRLVAPSSSSAQRP